MRRENFLITIGIGNYKNADLNLGECCVNDCIALTSLLREFYDFKTLQSGFDRHRNEHLGEQILLNDTATRDNIIQLFENLSYHPRFDKQNKDELSHNLIIYYSGHATVEDNNHKEVLNWVPYDYVGDLENRDANQLYSVKNRLLDAIGNIRYHSLILISDSCHSAATFSMTDLFSKATNLVAGSDPEKERSCWALCSSASNLRSKAGQKFSLFTGHLLEELQSNMNKKLSLEQLFVNLNDRLKLTPQRPLYGRLGILPDNTGIFYFNANKSKEMQIVARNREKELKNTIYDLNYIIQRNTFEEFRGRGNKEKVGSKHYFISLSADPEYGLKIVHHLVKISRHFPVKYLQQRLYKWDLKNELPSNFSIDTVRRFLASSLLIPQTNGRDFEQILNNRLKAAPIIVEVYIPYESMVPQAKRDFINVLYSFLKDLKIEEDCHPFFIVLIDSNQTDYKTLLSGYETDQVVKYVMPPITDIGEEGLLEWYERSKGFQPDTIEMFEALFYDVIECVKNECFDSPAIPPGKLIKEICIKSGCEPLAISLLNY